MHADPAQFDARAKWLAVTTAERVFIFRALPNGTHETLADYQNIAPFYLNKTFPDNWFRCGNPYSLGDTGTDTTALIASSPALTVPGQNQGLNNFVPLGLDLADFTPEYATYFLATTVLDVVPGDFSPVLAEKFETVQAFMNAESAAFGLSLFNMQCH